MYVCMCVYTMYHFSPRKQFLPVPIPVVITMLLTLTLMLRRTASVAPTTGCCYNGRSVLPPVLPVLLPIATRRVVQRVAFVTIKSRPFVSTSRNIRTHDGTERREQKYALPLLSLSSVSRLSSTVSSTAATTATIKPIIPRAAVSVAVRVQCHYRDSKIDGEERDSTSTESLKFYLLIQRGTEPSKGMWSLPGGKVEYQETTFHAAQRELSEETKWSTSDALSTNNDNNNEPVRLQWFNETVLTTDAIGDGYHYVIAHYFAQHPTVYIPTNRSVARTDPNEATSAVQRYLPIVLASDDAMDAQWYTISDIVQMEMTHTATRGVARVLQRIEACDAANLLV